jgi:uncharacterized protein
MLDPLVLFFALGFIARLAKSDLRLPESLYEALSIYLLLAIGLKGGVEIARQSAGNLLPEVGTILLMGALLPLPAFAILRAIGKFSRADAGSIAGHYGSVSVVTFAVGVAYLNERKVAFEAYMPLFVAILEIPGIVVGILLAKSDSWRSVEWGELLREVLLGKSIVLLLGGLAIGWLAGAEALKPIEPFYTTLFKGVLSLFLLEMGLVAASRISEVRKSGLFLVLFATLIPLTYGVVGALVGHWLGLSLGGVTLLAILAASASYIAAPTAMRIAVPKANPGLSIGAALGVTFPFNIIVGVPIYFWMAETLARR